MVPEAPLGMGSAYTNPHELLGIVDQPGAVKDPAFAIAAMEAPLPVPKPPQLVDFQAIAPPAAARGPQLPPAPLVMAPPLNAQAYLTLGHAPTTHFNSPPTPATPSETERLLRELTGQIEQLRNDFFSAATTISALSDRMERLEKREPGSEAPSNATAEVAALRADFEAWIAQHLETTVEHCMRRVWARAASMQQPVAANPPTA
ncbi:MAG: hypothetical protein U1F81_15255 [Verrucomicrobiaceae bacterium]